MMIDATEALTGFSNVQDTLNSLRKLAKKQGCLVFTDKDNSLMVCCDKAG